MEGDGQIRRGGEELEGAASPDVPAQDASRDLVAVGDGQHVAVADVQSEDTARGTQTETEARPVASVQDE